jgi:hypothetical protein
VEIIQCEKYRVQFPLATVQASACITAIFLKKYPEAQSMWASHFGSGTEATRMRWIIDLRGGSGKKESDASYHMGANLRPERFKLLAEWRSHDERFED